MINRAEKKTNIKLREKTSLLSEDDTSPSHDLIVIYVRLFLQKKKI